MKPIIKKGDKYNKLTAVRFDHMDGHRNAYWIFQCDCGNKKIARVSHIKSGNIKSCGCLRKEKAGKLNKTHGMRYTREYNSWQGMKDRCHNENSPHYKGYGSRGITVCDRWRNSFENFFADMGKKPTSGHSIDRINNEGNYEPHNCRWATWREQENNKRNNHWLNYKGKTQTVAQWAREIGLSRMTLYKRLKRGWDIKKALTI